MSDTGWLIEKRDSRDTHRWLRVLPSATYTEMRIDWTNTAAVAMRFARESDAVEFAKLHIREIGIHLPIITEHSWGLGEKHE